MDQKKYYETPIRDEKLLEEARLFLNQFCGLNKHKFTKNELKVMSRFRLSLKLDALLWKILRPEGDAAVDTFYRITPFEFMKNLLKNMDGMHNEIRAALLKPMREYKIKTVLDFGGGSGFMSLVLQKLGFDVTFAEVNVLSLNWMVYLNNKYDLNVKIIDLMYKRIEGYYDAIIVKDVLEHCNHPKEIIDDLNKRCKLLFVSPEEYIGPEDWLPMHRVVKIKHMGHKIYVE